MRIWSTRESINNDEPSLTAIAETILAVFLYWWVAIRFETYLPLLFSAFAALLVLLRSDESEALGRNWFARWEDSSSETFWGSTLLRPLAHVVMSTTGRIGFAFIISYAIAPIALGTLEDWRLFLGSALICWVSTALATGVVSLVAGASKIIVFKERDLVAVSGPQFSEAVGSTTGIAAAALTANYLILVGAIVGGLFTLVASRFTKPAVGEPRLIGALLISLAGTLTALMVWGPWGIVVGLLTIGCTVYGSAAGVLLVSLAVRMSASLYYWREGIKALPRNFRRLWFCTSPIQPPELVPGLDDASRFTMRNFLAEFRAQSRLLGYVIYSVLLFGWFAPGWVYRFALKSTFCFWWPLVFLGGPVRDAKNPTWFRTKVLHTLWGHTTIVVSLATIMIFVLRAIWQQEEFENPFLHIFGYAFTINWDAGLWQVCALAGALMSITILYWTNWEYKKFAVANRTDDDDLRANATLHFKWIEILARVRTVLFLVYCFLVLFHAVMYLNTSKCWFVPTSGVQRWAESLYLGYLPPTQCNRSSSL